MSTMSPCRCWPIDLARNIPSNDRALAKTALPKHNRQNMKLVTIYMC